MINRSKDGVWSHRKIFPTGLPWVMNRLRIHLCFRKSIQPLKKIIQMTCWCQDIEIWQLLSASPQKQKETVCICYGLVEPADPGITSVDLYRSSCLVTCGRSFSGLLACLLERWHGIVEPPERVLIVFNYVSTSTYVGLIPRSSPTVIKFFINLSFRYYKVWKIWLTS